MPAQVHFEYLKNKGKVVEKPMLSYRRLLDKQNKDGGYVNTIVEKAKALQSQELGEIKNQLKTLKEQTLGAEKHPHLALDIYLEFDSALTALDNSLTAFSSQKCLMKLRKKLRNFKAVYCQITYIIL